MMTEKKNVLLIIPSLMVARGIEQILGEVGEFKVIGILSDLSRGSANRLRNIEADVVVIDPIVFDYESRANGRSVLADFTDAPAVAIETSLMDEETLRPYDAVIGIYDAPTTVVRKLRSAVESQQDSPRAEGEELSSREKEILVSVAKGMLNKEIADQYNISIYTVITHRKNITRKTGIKTVAGLTVYALLNNLIDINSIE
ncbi:MAG: response regulator transcription factor [Bacteroidales bacterium]|nr:response regulator transcription factor [Bacteroidales bacterium]